MAALESILEGGLESTNSLTRVQSCAARLAIRTDQSTPPDVPQTAVEQAAEQLFGELENHLEGIHSQELRTIGVDRLELEALFCSAAIALQDPHTFELWIGRLRSAISTPTRGHLSEFVELNTLREPNAGPERNALEFAVRSSHWTSRPPSLGSVNNTEPFQPLVTPEKGQVVLMYAQDGTNVVVSIITEHSQTIETVGSLKDIRTRTQSVCLGAAGLFGSRAGGTKRGEERAASLLRAIDQLQVLVLPVSLPSGDVVISTTGSLGTVPWYLFPRLVARSITLTSSSSGRRRNTPGEASPNRVRVGIVEGPGLDHGAGEVDAVAEFYNDPIVLRGTQATVQAVSDLLTSTDLVHVVAHGRRRVDNALFSGIELVDGALMAYDIERLRSTPKTVVLSCCDLGAANSQGAFGLLGFSGALVSRGTSQVAAAVLPVSDEMSKAVMVRLHRAIKKGKKGRSVSQAVADAVANAESLFERVTAGSYVVKGP